MTKRLAVFFVIPAVVGAIVGVLAPPAVSGQGPLTSLEEWVRATPLASTSPSPSPTATPSPSASVTDEPSATPTPTPSEEPSDEPSDDPSEEPSDEPSDEPSEPVELSTEELQEQLTELRYYEGPIDGNPEGATRSALMAFQKVAGITVDGAAGDETYAAMVDPPEPQLGDGDDMRVEVDLDLQVLHWVVNGEIERTMPVSSGSGQAYTTANGNQATSVTPVGEYVIERRIDGVRNAPLGTLYDPLYFYEGWAIHGSNSVPAHPASHGCVRLTREDARWLFDRAPDGTQVILYGGEFVFTPEGREDPGTDTPGA